ncbi:hypothetical protein NC653_024221 [Populus alba x Populus x berolinensis]|uniref:Uncharacterized protein n=1 Tax=Populus alba x Populus x berolinensis TaxID=444605 RepID=A0AAD6M8E6_9ROSI|nr:hypothetical protein NC653_024221 [Populus alba x Populus x berolinensis]
MREAANHFIGTHDLSASVNSSRNDGMANPVKMELCSCKKSKAQVSCTRQVRKNMVALLLQIGKEAIPPDIVPKIPLNTHYLPHPTSRAVLRSNEKPCNAPLIGFKNASLLLWNTGHQPLRRNHGLLLRDSPCRRS